MIEVIDYNIRKESGIKDASCILVNDFCLMSIEFLCIFPYLQYVLILYQSNCVAAWLSGRAAVS